MTIEHTQHVPVMPEEVLRFLQPRSGGYYIDGTVGGGGHTAAILEQSEPDGKVLGIDADELALTRVRARLSHFVDNGRLVLVHSNFARLAHVVAEIEPISIEGVLRELGSSS